MMEEPYDSRADTLDHIKRVGYYLMAFEGELDRRGELHDDSKLKDPEKAIFDRATQRLKGLTYGSEEYKAALADMQPALDHHYAKNSHHPEHEVATTEEWRAIEGYEGCYEVSNLGRVRSLERVVPREGTRGDLTMKELIRRAHVTPKGYPRVQLSKDGERRSFFVHSLVATAFLEPSSKGAPQVNHKSGNKRNNRVENLEWTTPSENLQHAYDTELRQSNAKYVFVCEELDLFAIGAVKMTEACHQAGHEKVTAFGIWNSAMRGHLHQGLAFSALPLDEAFPYSGLSAMNLIDLVEMFADWCAATERHEDGDIQRSISLNATRFNYPPLLVDIFMNTARDFQMGAKPPKKETQENG